MRSLSFAVLMLALVACSSSSDKGVGATNPPAGTGVVTSMHIPKDTTIYASGRPLPVRVFVSNARDAYGNVVANPYVIVVSAPTGWIGSGTASRVAPMSGAASAADTTITPKGDQSGTVTIAAGADTGIIQVLAQVDLNRYHWRATYSCYFPPKAIMITGWTQSPDSAQYVDTFDSTITGGEYKFIAGHEHVTFFAGVQDTVLDYPVQQQADELLGIDTLWVGSGAGPNGTQGHYIYRVNADTATFPHFAGLTTAYCPAGQMTIDPSTGFPIVLPLDLIATFDKTTGQASASRARLTRR